MAEEPTIDIHIHFLWNSSKPADQFVTLERVVDLFRGPPPGNNVSVELDDQADKPSPVVTETPTRKRRTRTNGAEQPAPPAQTTAVAPPVEDVAGDDKPDDEAEDLGLNDPGMTGQEALERSMGGIRSAFNVGHKDAIYALRKKWGVTKFDEIAAKDGHALYKDVSALLEKVGMHI